MTTSKTAMETIAQIASCALRTRSRDVADWIEDMQAIHAEAASPQPESAAISVLGELLQRAEALGWNNAGMQEGLCADFDVTAERAAIQKDAEALFAVGVPERGRILASPDKPSAKRFFQQEQRRFGMSAAPKEKDSEAWSAMSHLERAAYNKGYEAARSGKDDELALTIAAIDAAWRNAYGAEDESATPTAARNRVTLLANGLKAAQENFSVTNAAYVKADNALRAAQSAMPRSERAKIIEECAVLHDEAAARHDAAGDHISGNYDRAWAKTFRALSSTASKEGKDG